AVTIGEFVQLQPGQLVLDVGSGCGHLGAWYFEWFGARTLGLDFLQNGVEFAKQHVTPVAPTQFCWMDVASQLGSWLPDRSVHLATAISVLHYMRSDVERWEAGSEPYPNSGPRNVTRTPCHKLFAASRTQCRVAWEMFRATKVGGHTWVAHNGAYKGKWDPKRAWGQRYWRCCFYKELMRKEIQIREVPENDIFLTGLTWDETYSLILKRLA
ncbi:unnamed protein product, partial [Effrenium voratum]